MIHLSLTPLLDVEKTERLRNRPDIKCANCGVATGGVEYCEFCRAADDAVRSRSLVSRIKSKFGFELSTELIVLSLEQPDQFFTASEIDRLINPENMVPLDTKDVPNWEIMFFPSKRIKRPKR